MKMIGGFKTTGGQEVWFNPALVGAVLEKDEDVTIVLVSGFPEAIKIKRPLGSVLAEIETNTAA